jgi:hypothetical protein
MLLSLAKLFGVLLPWCLCLSLPCPPSALSGPDPPMAISRFLGGFHVSVTILPVTATTCGAPSGGPGTTSESHRLEICGSFMAQQLHKNL